MTRTTEQFFVVSSAMATPPSTKRAAQGQYARRVRRGPPPLSIRLSEAERIELRYRAGRLSLGRYIKLVLFNGSAPIIPRRAHRSIAADEKQLAAILAWLGASRISSNLNQLAHAANIGVLPLDDQTRDTLLKACADIGKLRADLMEALGHRPSTPSGGRS